MFQQPRYFLSRILKTWAANDPPMVPAEWVRWLDAMSSIRKEPGDVGKRFDRRPVISTADHA
jgi:hypothetical protein